MLCYVLSYMAVLCCHEAWVLSSLTHVPHDRVLKQQLSDTDHFIDGKHNKKFDQESFLGKEEAKRFSALSPEEGKQQLGLTFAKIDMDNNRRVTVVELEAWIRRVQRRHIDRDVKEQWKQFNLKPEELMSLETYNNKMFGFLNDDSEDLHKNTYERIQSRNRKRWRAADESGDGLLSQAEFAAFLHPEEAEHMHYLLVQEAIQDIDRDGNELISEDEYIADIFRTKKKTEPEWVQAERSRFKKSLDLDGDSQLSSKEVQRWILPDDDFVHTEALHLIQEADANKDGQLSKPEVLKHYSLFVSSQATDYGDVLTNHEEL